MIVDELTFFSSIVQSEGYFIVNPKSVFVYVKKLELTWANAFVEKLSNKVDDNTTNVNTLSIRYFI
jgi:hypothetical protein